MKYYSSDPMFLVNVLNEVQAKTTNLQTATELCTLSEAIAMLKEALKPGDAKRATTVDSNADENAPFNIDQGDGDQSSDQPTHGTSSPEEESSTPLDDASVEEELKHACDALLQSIASQAKDMTDRLTTGEIRRLLVVYALLPFEANDLIDHLDEEVSCRLSYLQGSSSVSLESLLRRAQSKSMAVNATLFKDTSSSRFGSIKNGIMSMFRFSDSSETTDENAEENNLTEELACLIQESIASTSAAAERAEKTQTATRMSLDSILQSLDEGSAFELGRCQELIENYRRIEFSTGTLRSRYDKERRQDIAKRVLSRLIP
jgi:hypothetical protein